MQVERAALRAHERAFFALEHGGRDAGKVKKARQHEAAGAGADDGDTESRGMHSDDSNKG